MLWLGPATKPSSDMEILKRSLDTLPPGKRTPCRSFKRFFGRLS